jgi:hypothetical protein
LLPAFAQAGVRRAMDLEPELSGFGYRVPRDRNETPEEAETRFLASRAEMLGEHGVDEFIRAVDFLSKFGRRKSPPRSTPKPLSRRRPHAPGPYFRSTRNALSNC